jgi:hypothetical protein
MKREPIQINLEEIDGKRVKVYQNLHLNTFSVLLDGKVAGHTDEIILSAPKFIVRPGGRARVVRERRKNIHAFVEGLFNLELNRYLPYLRPSSGMEVRYNPYDRIELGAFRYTDMTRVGDHKFVVLSHGRIFVDITQ